MVSTRGLRYKFSEGERVLCYEPDPTKAKVLYDSKVLEVIESKDKRGRRTVEYLIHFQGWNSSWDRCVSEDFVLKDTEENRQLQRDLAEKSQLQLGAYLYRRERKKGSTTTSAGPAKRTRQGFSDDGSSSSTQPDGSVCVTEGEAGDTDSSGSGSASSTQRRSPPPPNTNVGRAQITLPSALRDRLTFDYHLVVKRGRLSRVPATPCAAEILESFVKWFARAGAWHPARGRHDPPQPPRPDLLDVSCRLNLVREVADGLRVYFDFILRGHLLYKQEMNQYYQICGPYAVDEEMEGSAEECDEGDASQDEGDGEGECEGEGEEEAVEGADATESYSEMRSPRIPEYSHLPPDPSDIPHTSTQPSEQEDAAKGNSSEKAPNKRAEPADDSPSPTTATATKPRERRTSTRTMPVRVARRLRSHKSAVSHSEPEEPVPSTSTEQKTFETLSSSGSSLSDAGAMAANAPAPAPAPTRTPLSLLLDKVAKWQIIPREGTEHLPCRVYGAIHLARLFVKLPDFLNATQMPDIKLKLILKHIDMFVQYLDEHNEWFGEMYYVGDNVTRSN